MKKEKTVLPIKTIKDGNVTTKVCVEDIYKIINRVQGPMDKAYKRFEEIIESYRRTIDGVDGYLVMGKGTSKPCLLDAYDEEIGSNIAFMKAKLNVNLKKMRLLDKLFYELLKVFGALYDEHLRLDHYIQMDLRGIRNHNPEYLIEEFPEYETFKED